MRGADWGYVPVSDYCLPCGKMDMETQHTAIDVWAAGMILLFFLTKKFPLFQANDDIEAMMEIAVVIGRRKMEKVTTLHSSSFFVY